MRGIVAGGILMTSPFWSLVVTVVGIARSFALLDQERAPRPEEFLAFVEWSRIALCVAAVAFVIGSVVVVWSSFAIGRSRASAVPRASAS